MIRPEYEDLDFMLRQAEKHGLKENDVRKVIVEIGKFPILRQIAYDLRKSGYNDLQIINHIYKNLDDISDARRNKWRNGEFIKVGRPKKDPSEKAKRKKADRYKTIKDLRSEGTINVENLRNINYNDIKNLKTKEAQRIAYYLQQRIKNSLRGLHKAGFYNENAERNFKDFGGFVEDIRTATLNQLKSFIRRGINFIRKESSTATGVNRIRSKVVKGLSKTISDKAAADFYNMSKDEEKNMWRNVKRGVELGYGSAYDKESRYRLIELAILKNEDDIDWEDIDWLEVADDTGE